MRGKSYHITQKLNKMERGDNSPTERSQLNGHFDSELTFSTSNVFLDRVGTVILSLNSTGLSWKPADSPDDDESVCWARKFLPDSACEIKFSEIYAVESLDWGSIRQPRGYCFRHTDLEMHRFVVHGMRRSQSNPCLWQLGEYKFGHMDQPKCETLLNQINSFLNKEKGRPKSLLVFVNPKSGKGNGHKIWGVVAPIFSRAKVSAEVTVTERSGHAFDVVTSMTSGELNSYDGIVAVGGDGLFNEILNGILSSRLKTSYPPAPPDFMASLGKELNALVTDPNGTGASTFHPNEDQFPLFPTSRHDESEMPSFRMYHADEGAEFSMPHKWFRFGIIPAGSTDAVVICTTGARDPVTSALHIVLGKRIDLDIAQVVCWKATKESKVEPSVRYTASFVGYGFYGDVIMESEKFRWMGPTRYDFAGTKVFLRHRSYEAEIAYLDVKSDKADTEFKEDDLNGRKESSCCGHRKKQKRVICRANCEVCNAHSLVIGESRWLKSKGHFLSAGAAVISCRNEKAPDGLVADAHLSDGFLHLILVKNCWHASYLWHLIHLARKGGTPLDFNFVEHHKTSAFTFTSSGKEGVWNLDGEILQAHKLSAQVLRGLVSLFAAGPEV